MKQEFMSVCGKYIFTRRSRWIQIRYEYVTPRHSLYDYADSGDEWEGKRCLTYFIKEGRKYALGQFMRFDYPFRAKECSHVFQDKKGLHILTGYDCTNYYNPYLIEVSDDGECVRLYTQKEVVA